jgi:ribosome recycling factor
MENEVLDELHSKMQKAVAGFAQQLSTIRTGRANPSLVKNIQVEYHGAQVPLEQIAAIAAPEANLIVIRPWENGIIRNIEKAILKDDIGLNPSNDGSVVRVIIPKLSDERRSELAKLVAKRVEERRVSLRNMRRETVNRIREMEKNKEISQDQLKRLIRITDELCEEFIDKANVLGLEKEKEIKEI